MTQPPFPHKIFRMKTLIRKAKISDVDAIHKLIHDWAKRGKMLDRSLNYLYENIRNFWVYEQKSRIIGCCALGVIGWEELGEIRSIVVDKRYQRKGIGKSLVLECIKEAKQLGITKLFTLTFIPDFFKSLGFSLIDRKDLPHKIWADCINCVYFPDCKEQALILKLK